jgi:hypothetical protein
MSKSLGLVLCLTLSLGAAASPCPAADRHDIQQLLHDCTDEEAPENILRCLGFIAGISDMMEMNGYLRSQSEAANEILAPYSTCAGKPRPAHGAELQAFTNWARKHPADWDGPEAAGVMVALRETWPCK